MTGPRGRLLGQVGTGAATLLVDLDRGRARGRPVRDPVQAPGSLGSVWRRGLRPRAAVKAHIKNTMPIALKLNDRGFIAGTAVLAAVVFAFFVTGAVYAARYETQDCADAADIQDFLTCYAQEFDLWKDALLAIGGVVVMTLVYIAFQVTVFNVTRSA